MEVNYFFQFLLLIILAYPYYPGWKTTLDDLSEETADDFLIGRQILEAKPKKINRQTLRFIQQRLNTVVKQYNIDKDASEASLSFVVQTFLSAFIDGL